MPHFPRSEPKASGEITKMDVILLEGIQVPAALGVTAAERRMRRPVLLDLEVERDLRAAGPQRPDRQHAPLQAHLRGGRGRGGEPGAPAGRGARRAHRARRAREVRRRLR